MAKRKIDVGKAQLTLPGRMIRTAQVLHILEIRKKIEQTKALLTQDAAELKKLEESVIADLKARIPLEEGCPTCAIGIDKRRNVKYKEVLIEELGEDWVKDLIAKTPETKTPYLIITEVEAETAPEDHRVEPSFRTPPTQTRITPLTLGKGGRKR